MSYPAKVFMFAVAIALVILCVGLGPPIYKEWVHPLGRIGRSIKTGGRCEEARVKLQRYRSSHASDPALDFGEIAGPLEFGGKGVMMSLRDNTVLGEIVISVECNEKGTITHVDLKTD